MIGDCALCLRRGCRHPASSYDDEHGRLCEVCQDEVQESREIGGLFRYSARYGNPLGKDHPWFR